MDAIVLTPICPHSLTMRPIVISADSQLTVHAIGENADPLVVSADGETLGELAKDESVHVSKADFRMTLVHRKNRTYFDTLRKKLSWGEDIRQGGYE